MASAVALWAALLLAPEPDLQGRLDRAEVAVSEGRWLDAAADYEVVFEATGKLEVRYAQAEALRLGGRCDQALSMYDEYLTGNPSQAMRTRTEQLIRVCEEELEATRAREAALQGPPLPDSPPEDAPTELDDDPPPPPTPWYRDPAGDALVGVGLATSIAGGVVLGLGIREGNTRGDAPSDLAFSEQVDRANTMTLAGGVTLGIGGAVAIAGVVRWALVGRRARAVNVAIGRNGLVLSGRLPSL